MQRLLSLLALALAGLAAAGAAGLALAGEKQRPAATTTTHSVQAEIMLNAERAVWRPGKAGVGTLVLDDVDPRMAVMAIAPRKESVVVPASLLASNWKALFGKHGNETNVILSLELEGRRQLVPFRARLLAHHRSGRRLSLAVSPLHKGAHALDELGPKPAGYQGVTLLVDPTITDAIKALWSSLVAFFSGKDYEPPPNPTYDRDGHTYYTNGFDPELEYPAVYSGPPVDDITDAAGRLQLQIDLAKAFGLEGWTQRDGIPSFVFDRGTYDGLPIFDGARAVIFEPTSGRVDVTNSTVFQMDLLKLEFKNADVGGINLRGTTASQVTIENSAFDTVDVTGSTLGSEGARSTISNSVFERVSGNETTRSRLDDNQPDRSEGRGTAIRNVDFVSVSFHDVVLRSSRIDETTFQGCGLSSVDLSGATIVGTQADPGEFFDPSFENSTLENVKFDGAELTNISFANADFSGGGVSLDGARLENVDFTGATGLQYVDWSNIEIAGPVYGLESVAHLFSLRDHPEYLRYATFDGRRPGYDAGTGFDIAPDGLLIDPATGVRYDTDPYGKAVPVDPDTRLPFMNDEGDPLEYDTGRFIDPETNAVYEVDYATGRLRGE